jgi:hypothetical protein
VESAGAFDRACSGPCVVDVDEKRKALREELSKSLFPEPEALFA